MSWHFGEDYTYPIIPTVIINVNNEIHRRVKKLLCSSYACIIQVYIIEKASQDIHIASKWLWDDKEHFSIN